MDERAQSSWQSRARTLAWTIVGGAAIFASCTVSEIDLDGKRCPCADGWTCIEATQLCVPGHDAGGKGGDASTKGGAGGTGAMAATGGRPDSGPGGISSGGQAGSPSGGSAGIGSGGLPSGGGGVLSGGGGVLSGGGGLPGTCVGSCGTQSAG